MNTMSRFLRNALGVLAIGAWGWALAAAQAASPAAGPAYVNDFEKADAGSVPEDMMVLAGEFAIRQAGGNQFLELAGTPLNTFGLFVGPESVGNAACGARILGSRAGKRFPEFGVGLGGASGYRLWLMPAVNELQIVKDLEVQARLPYQWTSGTWTVFRLQQRTLADGKSRLQGKAWEFGQPEPDHWMIDIEVPGPLPTGRASIWGIPYSELPVHIDDVIAS